jgi:hypothetical protein
VAKKSLPSKKTIRELLVESVFDPREINTPFSIVIGMQDPNYCESKAVEMIHEAKLALIPFAGENTSEPVLTNYHEKIAKAISLLALARSLRGPVQSERIKEERT